MSSRLRDTWCCGGVSSDVCSYDLDLSDEELELQGDVRDRFWLNAEAGKIELSRAQKAAVTVANFYHRNGDIISEERRVWKTYTNLLVSLSIEKEDRDDSSMCV